MDASAGVALGRWRCSTWLFGARDDDFLPSLTDGPFRTHDAAPPRRPRDQAERQPGELLCTVSRTADRAIGRARTATEPADGAQHA
jgi:hypothetical protein